MSEPWNEPQSDWEREAAARIDAERDRHRKNPKPEWEVKPFAMPRWQQGRTEAGTHMRRAFAGGLLLNLLASILYNQPDADAQSVGLGLAGVGGALITVAALAWAVSLGVRHAQELRD